MDHERITKVFGLKKREQQKDIYIFKESDGLLEMRVAIDQTKYKNRLSCYTELLKHYFARDHIYVLSRVKERRGVRGIFAILFQNSKASVMSEMKRFVPNYLVKRPTANLLVTIEDDCLKVYELPEYQGKQFSFHGYRYKEANEIKLQ